MNFQETKKWFKQSPLFGESPNRGSYFNDLGCCFEKGYPLLRQIIVRKGVIIDQVTFVYKGLPLKHGGNGGNESKFDLKENEFIVKVTGDSKQHAGQWRIANLVFHTNEGRIFKVGTPNTGGTHFEYQAQKGSIIYCLFGWAEQYVERIGFYELAIPQKRGYTGMGKSL